MATQGPNLAGTGANNNSAGTDVWSSPSNAASNASVAAVTLTSGTSQYLQGSNFGFSIPSTATINGIAFTIFQHAVSGSSREGNIFIVKGGTISGTNKGASTTLTNADRTYGSASDLWGVSWLASDINASNFGVVWQCGKAFKGAPVANANNFRITITYTIPGGTFTNISTATNISTLTF